MERTRVAVVTGASRNIGRAIALSLAGAGCRVVCFGRDRAALEETVRLIEAGGGAAGVVLGDVRSNEAMSELIASAVALFGRVDVVVNNAGVMRGRAPAKLTPEQFAEDLQVNLVGPFALARAAYPVMKEGGGGVIVNIGSVGGAMAFPGAASYCASKAGLDGLTRALAFEWARDNIRVVCVAPGYVESDTTADAFADPEVRKAALKRVPLRRFARPEEVGDLVAFLASERAGFITGETYYQDGGQRMAT